MKKMRIFWLCMLVVLLSFSSTSAFLQGKSIVPEAIITVDDEGDGDYTSIKEAVNHSNPGDIIEVYSGTYYEHDIIISKNEITLKGIPYELGNGNDIGKPFINGQGLGHVIEVEAQQVTISGFRMENYGGDKSFSIISIGWDADYCVISENDISRSVSACLGCASNYSKIVNNTISHSYMREGILLGVGRGHNLVSGNSIIDCSHGITLWSAFDNVITRNRISQCEYIGMGITGGDDNIIYLNTFEENYLGLFLSSSVGNKIEKNNFINNTQNADFILGLELPLRSRWIQNYWGEPRLLPYPIIGNFLFFPWVNFDWHPAKMPYEI